MKRNLLRILPFLLLGGALGLTAAPAAFEAAETKAEAKGAMYSLVTDLSSLADKDEILLVGKKDTDYYACGSFNSSYECMYIEKVGVSGSDLYVGESNAKVITLGKNGSNYTFNYKEGDNDRKIGAYKAPNNHICVTSKSNASFTWTIAAGAENRATILNTNTDYGYLQFSAGNNRISNYKSTSGMTDCYIYRKSAAAKDIQLDKTEVTQNVGTQVTLTASGIGTYVPTSYVWSIEEGSEYVSLSTTSGNSTVVSFNYEGSAVVKCTADGQAEATCAITVSDYQYNILTKDKYFIAEDSGLAMLGSDLSYIGNVDFTDESNLWTLEKAYKGDNSYYVTNGEQYLAYNRDISGHERDAKESKIALTDEPLNAWTVSVKDTKYAFSTVTKKGQTRSLATHEETWYAFEGTSNYVKFLETGEFDHYVVDKLPTKTKYYVGEKFSTTNMKVTGYYTNGYSADITSKIVWEDLAAGTQAHGKFTSGEDVYDITVNGISVLGPKTGSMEVDGLRDTYLIGEMPATGITEVKVTYSDGVSEESKVLKKEEYSVSPEKIGSGTTKVVVSMVDFPDVKYEKEITPEHAKYFATNLFEIGDKVTLGTTVGAKDGNITGGNEIAVVDGSLKSQPFGYLPTPAMEFTVKQGVNSGTYAFEYNGAYLSSNGGSLDFGHVSNITGYKNENNTWSFDYPFMLQGESEPLYVHFDESAYTPGDLNGYVYSYERGVQIQATGMMEDGLMMLGFDLFKPISTTNPVHSEVELTYEINGQLVIYLPSEQTINEKNSFICTYVEPQNDYIDPYWEICPVNEPNIHVYYNEDSKSFKLDDNADYNTMFYRDMSKDFSHKVKSLSVSIPESMPNTVELNGTYNWVGIVVKAVFDNTTKKLPLGAYEVDLPLFDSYGPHTCTVTYGTTNNMVTGNFTVTVKGDVSCLTIKQQTSFVMVGDTADFSVMEEIPEDQPISWTTNHPEIASMEVDPTDSSKATLTAHKSGSIIIIVKSFDSLVRGESREIAIRQRPTGVSLDKTSNTIKQGESFTLVPTVEPADDDTVNRLVDWSSSDDSIAYVDSKGVVTGKNIGTATITVETKGHAKGADEGFKATCVVTVEEAPIIHVTSVSLDCDYKELDLTSQKTFNLNATVSPSNATIKSVEWSSSNDDIATVDQNGKVTAKDDGTCEITVKTVDGGLTAKCTIKVKKSDAPVIKVTDVSLNTTSKKIAVNEFFDLIAEVKPGDATDKQVTFTSSNDSIAKVDQYKSNAAKITGLKDGVATITARCGGIEATCTVTVGNGTVPVTSVSLSETSVELFTNETKTLTARINPSDATNKNVTWTSSDTNIVTVDSNGKITAVKEGTATITVTTVDGGKTATCSVTVKKGNTPTPDGGDDHTVAIIIGTASGVAAVGIGCGVGIPFGIKAHKKRKLGK